MLAHGTTTFECKSGYGLSRRRRGALGRARGSVARPRDAARPGRPRCSRTRCPRDTTRRRGWSVVAEMLPDVLAAGDVSALDIYVESVAFRNEDLRRMGELAARARDSICARTSSSSTANGSVPVAIEIGARSVDHLACLPDDAVRRSRPVADRRGAAARRRVPRRRAPGPGRERWPTPGRSACSATDLQPGHVAGPVAAAGDRAGRPPLPLVGARGAAGAAR